MQVSINVQKTDEVLTLQCGHSERILLAGLLAGHNLPYECATGTCGNCKAQVISGSVDNLWPNAPGAKLLKSSNNEILMCQSAASDSCVLKIRSLSKSVLSPFKPEHLSGFITRAGLLTHDVQLIELKLNSHMDYLAGQFVIVELPGVDGYRAYSMIDHDQGQDTLQLIIKNKNGGKFSSFVFDKDPTGTAVSIFGPLGSATFERERDANRDLVCVAGGTGVAGLMAVISEASFSGHFEKNKGALCFGVRSERDLFFLDRLSALVKQNSSQLSVFLCLSESNASEELKDRYRHFNFFNGFVHECLSAIKFETFNKPICFLAGPPVAVEASTGVLLRDYQVPVGSIRFDRFG